MLNGNNIFTKNRNLFLFVSSQFIALVGERITTIAFISFASQVSVKDGATSASLVGAFQIFPILLFSFTGGYLADKLRRKYLLISLNMIRVIVLLSFLFIFTTNRSLPLIYVCIICLGTITALYNPIKKSFVPFLVPHDPEQIKKGNWYLIITEILGTLVGMSFGTLLLNFLAPLKLLFFDAIFFIISIVILFFLSVSTRPRSNYNFANQLSQFKRSIAIARTNRAVSGLMLLLVLPFYLSAGFFYAAASHWAAFITPNNTGESMGRLFLFVAVGAIAGYPLTGYLKNSNEYAILKKLFLLASFCMLGLAVFSSIHVMPLAYFFALLCGIFIGLLYSRTIYMFQLIVGKEFIGKITSLNEVIFGVAFTLAILFSIALGDLYSYTVGWLITFGLFMFTFFLLSFFGKYYFDVVEQKG